LKFGPVNAHQIAFTGSKIKIPGVGNYTISGRNHLYSLNRKARMVESILLPMFQKEDAFKADVFEFIKTALKKKK
jgi:hypothetical protein